MTTEDYLRRYAEPFQSLAGSGSTGDWQALVLDPDYYYPPHAERGSSLDTLNRTDLLDMLQQILAIEYPQQRLSRAKVQEFLEAFQRLKDERAWRQTEMERLAMVLAQYQSDHDRMTAELIAQQRLGAELDHYRNQAAMLRANLTDLRASTSWKVTKPLRWFGRLAKAMQAPDV
jgi:hypothetical protein